VIEEPRGGGPRVMGGQNHAWSHSQNHSIKEIIVNLR
jgi:hypothetical protein